MSLEEPTSDTTRDDNRDERNVGVKSPSFTLKKRIGSTTYELSIYFNPSSKETMDDKILRLIRGEAMKGKIGQ
jgi:hypothetical protein